MTAIYVISAFYGLGNGCYLEVDYALALDCLPSKETAGKDLGVRTLRPSRTDCRYSILISNFCMESSLEHILNGRHLLECAR